MASPYLERRKRKLEEVLSPERSANQNASADSRFPAPRRPILTGSFIVLPCLFLLALGAWMIADDRADAEPPITAEDMDKILKVSPAAGSVPETE